MVIGVPPLAELNSFKPMRSTRPSHAWGHNALRHLGPASHGPVQVLHIILAVRVHNMVLEIEDVAMMIMCRHRLHDLYRSDRWDTVMLNLLRHNLRHPMRRRNVHAPLGFCRRLSLLFGGSCVVFRRCRADPPGVAAAGVGGPSVDQLEWPSRRRVPRRHRSPCLRPCPGCETSTDVVVVVAVVVVVVVTIFLFV